MRDLLWKYHEIRALRAHDSDEHADDPKPRMRALATRFPGALRELDELPFELLETRIVEVEAALRGDMAPPRWARLMLEYHAWMRAALDLRRAAGPSRDRERALAWIDRDFTPPGQTGPGAAELRAATDVVLRPPAGRLNRWLLTHLAARHGGTPETVEAELFPPSPRRRARR